MEASIGKAEAAIDQLPKCWRCGRTLFEYAGRPWSTKCQRCNAPNRQLVAGERDKR